MRLPDLDPSGGPLSIKSVLIDYDGPQLFVASNPGNSRFLAMHALPDGKSDRWLYVRVSQARLKRYESGLESTRKIFEFSEFGRPVIVNYIGDNIDVIFHPNDWELDQLLPEYDSYLDPVPNVSSDMLLQQIQSVSLREEGAILERAQAPLWEIDPNVVAYLSAKRTPTHIAASVSHRTTIDIAFSMGKGRTDYPIKTLGSVLNSTQTLFDILNISDEDAPSRGPVPSLIKSDTQLSAVASFPSSFGLRIEADRGDLVGEDRLELALKKFLFLIQTVGSDTAFEEAVQSISRRAQRHFKAFARAIRSGKSDFSIKAATPHQGSTSTAHLSKTDINWLSQKLNKIVSDVEREITFEGRLTAVSLKKRYFMLSSDDGTEYAGSISTEALPKINEKRINHMHKAVLSELVSINETTGEEIFKYVLNEIHELD